MTAGLAAGYGMFAYIAARFLYPEASKTKGWVFVCETKALKKGESLRFQTPTGEKINVARVDEGDATEAFIALSSTCPHLGCQVHWEPQKNRFFCPCHNGVFTPEGKAIGGPPAEAGQSLLRKELQSRDGLLFMRVETQRLAASGVLREIDHPQGSGHDPCLAPQNTRLV
ncbi:MAG: Rieske (2Fe-2S) protein [Planctomycetes bacterium]|nr:Rieske (2Fe-2S) protein [Planctomycetota bacterium]